MRTPTKPETRRARSYGKGEEGVDERSEEHANVSAYLSAYVGGDGQM